MAYHQARGIKTYVQVRGSGPALLLLHGWANSWEAWLPIIPYLADKYTLYLPDFPGCGRSETPQTGWTTADHSQWLEELIGALDLSTFSACGHSYGGKTLLWHQSETDTTQAKKLIVIDASGIPNHLTVSQQILRTLAQLGPSSIKRMLPQSLRTKLYAFFGAESDYVQANAFQSATLQQILQEDISSKLGEISQDTLLVWGSDDRATPLWQGERMHTLLPNSTLRTFSADHFPHHKAPVQVAHTMMEFLS